MITDADNTKPIKIFYSYSYEDRKYFARLKTSLALLKRRRIIDDYGGRDINAGDDWKKCVDTMLEEARIVLLLVTPRFIASDYCYEYEMKRALIKHKLKLVRVIPIILTEVDFRNSPFGTIEVLPEKGIPVDDRRRWRNANAAYSNIEAGIENTIKNISKTSFTYTRSDMHEIIDLTDDLKEYAVEKISFKITKSLQSHEPIDETEVYWFYITLAMIGDKNIEPIIRIGLNSPYAFVALGARHALDIFQKKYS